MPSLKLGKHGAARLSTQEKSECSLMRYNRQCENKGEGEHLEKKRGSDVFFWQPL